MKAKLYKITNCTNGMIYMGVTTRSIEKRWAEHCHPTSCCKYLRDAIAKHGKENFHIETLVVGSKEYIYDLEPKAIQAFGSFAPIGYNLSEGGKATKGHTGKKHSASAKSKMSVAKIGKASPKQIGEFSSGAKLTEENVKEILRDVAKPASYWASRFNVSIGTIKDIYRNITWKYLPRSGEVQKYVSRYIFAAGFIFPNIRLAARTLGLSNTALKYRILSPLQTEYYFL